MSKKEIATKTLSDKEAQKRKEETKYLNFVSSFNLFLLTVSFRLPPFRFCDRVILQ